MDLPRAPCDATQVIFFDAENLKHFLLFIEASNMKAHIEINELKNKVLEIDDLRKYVKDKFDIYEQRFSSIEDSQKYHLKKLLDLETAYNRQQERLKIVEINQNETKMRINHIDDSVNKLNRITDDNCKTIDKLGKIADVLSSAIERQEKEIVIHSQELKKIEIIEAKSNELKLKLDTKLKKSKEKQLQNMTTLGIKFEEVDENFNTLFASNGLVKATKRVNLNVLSEHQSKKSTMETNIVVDSLKMKLDFLSANYQNFKDEISKRINDEREEYLRLIKSSRQNQDIFEQANSNSIRENHLWTEERLNKISSIIFEIKDTEKLLLDKLINKIEKDDLQKLHKMLAQEIEKNTSRINNMGKPEVNKQHPPVENTNLGKHDNEGEIIRKLDEKVSTSRKELDKVFESIIEIREKLTDIEKLPIKEGVMKIFTLEEEVKSMSLKRRNTMFIDPKNQAGGHIDHGTDENEDKDLLNFLNNFSKEIKDKIKTMNQRIDHISSKQESISGEILGKLKRDLTNESNRILEEFKLNLKNSMERIEDQLHDKVDKLNLDEIARKIDAKIILEVGRKLDKNDLRKSTGLINKKIENLENKISKTLVDTLIDLQLDDAPLLVKKSAQADKCGSCNQIVLNVPNPHSNSILSQNNNIGYENAFPTSNKVKSKTRNQTNSIATNTEGDDKTLRTSSNAFNLRTYSNMNPTALPEIRVKNETKKSSFTNNRNQTVENKTNRDHTYINSTKNKDNSKENLKLTEIAERQMSTMINEELEKQFINPEALLRETNRIFENIEKKKNNS